MSVGESQKLCIKFIGHGLICQLVELGVRLKVRTIPLCILIVQEGLLSVLWMVILEGVRREAHVNEIEHFI